MRKIPWFCTLFLFSFLARGEKHAGQPVARSTIPESYHAKLVAPPTATVDDLVAKLQSPQYQVREMATRELLALGPDLLVSEAFQKGLKSTNLETRKRVESVRDTLEAPYLPLEPDEFLLCMIKNLKNAPPPPRS